MRRRAACSRIIHQLPLGTGLTAFGLAIVMLRHLRNGIVSIRRSDELLLPPSCFWPLWPYPGRSL